MERIISGGQTGVDRAALDLALDLGIPCGGWCPQGRKAENGPIPERYPLRETTSAKYPPRTAMNIALADGTLILTRGNPIGGTALTIAIAKDKKKPFLVVDLWDESSNTEAVRLWLVQQDVRCLNVAGPRESENPGIYRRAYDFLKSVLAPATDSERPSSHS